ncbi:hypothetical protein [Bradyrhizobium liaoningense]|uniref:hypothetical protein n=1 Tax=Bradyrhizobium liaoningense TaxID=43992 RepID=UPI001BAB6186|nr:hypothetical protein [Bradyrhizobium liaoningense]MBR0906466.1 hypothetical protein [Bradyrhizobium liaoningense]
MGDGLLDPIQEHHSRNRDHQGRDAAKKKRLHPQPPSTKHQAVYTTRLAASKLVDRITVQAVLRALEDRVGGKCITHQTKRLKGGVIQVDFQDRQNKRKHDGNENQEGRGASGIGIYRSVERAKGAQSRQHLQKWPRSPLHTVIPDVRQTSRSVVPGPSAFKRVFVVSLSRRSCRNASGDNSFGRCTGGSNVKLLMSILCFATLGLFESASAQPAQTNSPAAQTPSEEKGQPQPQGWTGPINTGSGGAPAESPQGQSPPGMQAAPEGSSKVTTAPAKSK